MAAALSIWANVLRLCLFLAPARGYMTSSPERPVFDKTGIFHQTTGVEHAINWPSAGPPVPLQKEIQLLTSGTLLRRGEFGSLDGSRALEVELECSELGMSFHQAVSIRKQLMMRKMLKGSFKLKDENTLGDIKKKFEQRQRPLLELSQEYDLPPVSIFRAIVAPRVLSANPQCSCLQTRRPAGRIVQSIIGETDSDNVEAFLTEWELKQLQAAKENDVVGHQISCTAAEEWEDAIYTFLDERGINYLTEESMKLKGYETIGTPDCLLLDDLFINGQLIRWMEFKSYYVSGLKENKYFTKKAVSKQVEKYEKEFGKNGAVILKNGFSDSISRRYPSTMFLDGGPLHAGDDYSLLSNNFR